MGAASVSFHLFVLFLDLLAPSVVPTIVKVFLNWECNTYIVLLSLISIGYFQPASRKSIARTQFTLWSNTCLIQVIFYLVYIFPLMCSTVLHRCLTRLSLYISIHNNCVISLLLPSFILVNNPTSHH